MNNLKIAYISYEFPPDTSGGGIGSYIQQVAKIMHSYSHDIAVFCGTNKDDYQYDDGGIKVYRVKAEGTESFRKNVVNCFAKIHKEVSFDLIEGPEYGADGYEIKKAFPQLPYVVKCHSPSYIIRQYNDFFGQYILPHQKMALAKIWVKQLFNLPYYPFYNKEKDLEYINVRSSNKIFSPSLGLAKKLSKDWKLNLASFSIVPNPYSPTSEMLSIPLEYKTNRITFLGKLSVLKGMIDIIKAIPLVLKKEPRLKFRFIGQDGFAADGSSMSEYLLKQCSEYKDNIEIFGKVPLDMIPQYLGETDVVLCTSLWENYPTVILEAFSAGRCVIATKVGGIPEIVKHNQNGLLVNKKEPENMAAEILRVFRDKDLMQQLGKEGRESIQTFSASTELYKAIVNSYLKLLGK